MAPRPCKVIVVGGGVAGLALALMLEKHNIDYLLLEAYSDIVATAGAGIALSPNGLRVLDQLGCFEDILKLSASVDQVHFRKPGGELNWGLDVGLEQETIKRCQGILVLVAPDLPRLLLTQSPDTDILGFGWTESCCWRFCTITLQTSPSC